MKGEEAAISPSSSPSSSSSSSSSSKMGHDDEKHVLSVLAVDDNPVDRKLIQMLLNTSSSFTVTLAENGMKALEYLGLGENQTDTTEALKVDLVLTDYCMPEITGYDLLKKIKESSMKEVPVVILSSENVPERINKCLEEGAEMFLLKPLKLSDVQSFKDLLQMPSRN